MIKRVLVVLGGTPYARSAIRHGVDLAERHGARLTGFAVLDRHAHNVEKMGLRVAREKIEANLAELEDAAREVGVVHRMMREQGDPIRALCAEWRYQDLTILGLRGFIEYGAVSKPKEAASGLIRAGVHPILAVSKDHVPIKRILIAYSGSLESAASMKEFVQMRLWPTASVSLVHFIEGGEDTAGWQRTLADVTAYCADWEIELEARTRIGGARDHLVSYARENQADLIVMGDSARSLLTRQILGDHAECVIRTADRPLFISH